jgi:hypothetical protein
VLIAHLPHQVGVALLLLKIKIDNTYINSILIEQLRLSEYRSDDDLEAPPQGRFFGTYAFSSRV